VPNHEGIIGNERADIMARTGFEHLYRKPEPASRILVVVAKRAVRDWTNRNHRKKWDPQQDSNWQKDLYQGPLAEERRIC
jgi:ribonuclease HI